MKLYLTALCLMVPIFSLQAQTSTYHCKVEVIYQMTSQPDSTNASRRNTEFMSLLIGENQSIFCATQFLVMDSAIRSEHNKGNKMGPSMAFFQASGTHNHSIIFKDTTHIVTSDVILRYISINRVKYTESKNLFKWEITSDTTSIGGISCQKALTNFGGREWEAWFAPSIPISEGPYKFNGLPGLILQISDTKNFWRFDLASIKKIDKTITFSFDLDKAINIKDKKTFFSKRRNAMDNRFLLMKQKGMTFSDEAAMQKGYEAEAKADNNWIELYNPKK